MTISGESGCGKEVIARYIHNHSARSDEPFVAINCAAIPESMLEAVLFGYEKGAFTGASAAHPGKFEQAQGGTLLLDEISEMDIGLQAKLLRAGQLAVVANRTREITRSYQTLMRFLTSLQIPIITVLRDSQNFVTAAANGICIHELPAYKTKKDVARMDLIISWLDQWRMRRLDALTSPHFEHIGTTQVLTPSRPKDPH